jgi:photosystem II stability/assembly factor-like uncharacterized protein
MKKIFLISLSIMLLPNNIFCQWQTNAVPYNVQCFSAIDRSIIVGTEYGEIFISSDSGSTWQTKNNGLPLLCSVNSIITTGNFLFAGTDNGVFLSEDNGNNWQPTNNGLPSPCSIKSIITTGNLLFAGTDNGVFLSEDNGNNWQAKTNGLANIQVTSLSSSGNNLFAGTFGGGMYVTINSGDSWTSINNGVSNLYVSSIALDSNIIYIGTENGIFSSINNGTNWNSINNGIVNLKIKDIDLNGNCIFTLSGDSIYLSTDNGANWFIKNDPIWDFSLKYNSEICNVGISDDRIFIFRDDAKIYRSGDNGTNWVALNLSGSIIEKLTCEGNLIYVGTNSDGIYLSRDKGLSWKSVNNGIALDVYNIRDIVVDSHNVFICTPEGIFLSMDEGEHWEKVTDYFADNITISGNNVYAGRRDFRLSMDYGKTWNQVTNNLPHGFILSLASDGNKIYAGIDQYSRGLYISTDSGKNWVSIFLGSEVLEVEIDGNNIYIGTWIDGIYRSINNGDSWEQINNGLISLYANSIEKRGDILVAGGCLSTDNGNNWMPLVGANDVVDVGITEDFIFVASYGSVKRLPFPVLLLDDNWISFYEPTPGSATFNIISTTDWTITKSQDWLTCSEYSGSGHAAITINTTENPTPNTRVDTITVSGIGAISQKLVVRHYGQYLEISDDTLAIGALANSSQTFEIYSSVNWTIVSNQYWLSLSSSNGIGDASIILTATGNPTTDVRIATLTVSGIGFDDQIITVIQNAGITGISDITKEEYSVYPNPSSSILYFNTNNDVVIATIIDINGKIILSNKIMNNQINISNLQNGVYTVKIETATTILFRKFVKL